MRKRKRVRKRTWLPALMAGALLASGMTGLGDACPAQAIAHGADAKDGDYPFSTKLTMTGIPDGNGGRRDSSCSGGLIAARWILTAGHCFKTASGKHVSRTVAKKTTATVGRADLNGNRGQVATVIAVRQSPVADVALAQLDRPITGIAPMRLNRKAPKVGQALRLTGFGLRDGNDAEVTDRMQVGQFTITSVSRYELGTQGRSPRSDTSPCEHDSGGPYFVPDGPSAVVYGVVSYGPTCPHTGPDRSGRIDTIVSWALGIIGKDGPLPTPSKAQPSRTTKPPPAALPPGEPVQRGPSAQVMTGVGGAVIIGVFLIIGMAAGRRGRPRSRHRRR